MRKEGDLFPPPLHKLTPLSCSYPPTRGLPLQNPNSSYRARCSVWSHPAGPSLSWLRGIFLGEGRWLKKALAGGTAERLRGAQYIACGRQGNYHHHHWYASLVHHLRLTSFFGQKGGWGPHGSQLRFFCCFGHRIKTGPQKTARPVMTEQKKENNLWWRIERKTEYRDNCSS